MIVNNVMKNYYSQHFICSISVCMIWYVNLIAIAVAVARLRD